MLAWWREAIGAPSPVVWPEVRRAVLAMSVVATLVLAALSFSRFETFHNRTFDLAFYARIAWGEAHLDGWQPILGAPIRGLHLSWILVPLGFVGELCGQVRVLIVTQALALGLAAWPLAAIGARHGGRMGAIAAPLALLLHPNLALVGGDEFHPGTVAVLPLALLADALDRRSAPALVLSTLGVLACREDLGLVTTLASIALLVPREGDAPRLRAAAAACAIGSLAYVLLFLFVIHPANAPERGSLELHFGRLGSSVGEVVLTAFLRPGELVEHLAVPHRLACVPSLILPLGFLPLLRPRGLLVAAPVLGIAMLSEFPGTTAIDSHYLTSALPLLVGASAEAFSLLRGGLPQLVVFASLVAHVLVGGTPASLSFDASRYRADRDTAAGRALTALVPAHASIQAPDELLAHFAERRDVRRPPPPESGADFVVFDVSHRRRFRHREDLLRTLEEPSVRAWSARPDHALVAAEGDWLLFARDRPAREGIGFRRFVVGRADARAGRRLAGCLRLLDARPREDALVLDLVASGPCPSDLALALGPGKRPLRVDLLAGGLLSPALLEAGDRVLSVHALTSADRFDVDTWRVGAIRSSGARPEHADPRSIPLRHRRAP